MRDPFSAITTDPLADLRGGGADALRRLVPLVYRELRERARQQLADGRGGALDTTALVYAAYLELIDQSRAVGPDRARFRGVASAAMRQMLVDHAHAQQSLTGSGGRSVASLGQEALDIESQTAALVWLGDVMQRLTESAPEIARIVDCRFFGALTEHETSEALALSAAAVRRGWQKGTMLLHRAQAAESGDTARTSRSRSIVPDDWPRVEPLLDLLLDAPPEQRSALAHELSGGDTTLQVRLESLARDCERGAPLLERPAAERFSTLCVAVTEFQGVADALAERYRITRELGHGGMAVVYLALDVKHGRDVAVKVVRPEIAAHLGRERFLREIEITARLHHPHIVPVYDSGHARAKTPDAGGSGGGAADGVLYYVMPYEAGQSVRERLMREGPLPVADAVAILRDVCDALAHAHQQGIVHRDIKPDNVLLSGRHALVTDFGVARAVTSATGHGPITATGVTLGTPAYMAPEQIVADPQVDHRVDVYAVGILAYEMLTGRPPFVRDRDHHVLSAHLADAPEPVRSRRSDVPPALDEIVMRCLAKQPGDRWQSADEMLDRLEQMARSRGIAVEADTETRADDRAHERALATRRQRMTALVAGGLVVAVAVAGMSLFNRAAPERLTIQRAAPFTSDAGLELFPSLSPDGKLVAYSAGSSARMRIFVRQVTGARTWTLSDDTSAVETNPTWSPDGRRILFLSRGGASIAPASGGATRQIARRSASGPVRAATWSPDGREIAVVRGDSIIVYTEDGTLRRVLATGREWHSCAWSPLRVWLACVDGNPRYVQPGAFFANLGSSAIVLIGTTDGRQVLLTDSAGTSTNQSPRWSSDGSRLLFVSDRDGARDIFSLSIDQTGRTRDAAERLTTGLNVHSFSLDTANARLVYALYQEKANVWALTIPSRPPVTADGATPLTAGSQVIEILRVSNDGRWLYYDSNLHGNSDIFRIPVTGGEPERLTSDSAMEFASAGSPNGREFAYHRFGRTRRDVIVQRLSDGHAEQITATTADECCPTWSPDGDVLATSKFDSEGGIFIMRRDAAGRWGAPVPRLPRGFLHSWSPDGRHIAVASGRSIRGTDHSERLELVRPDSGDPVTLYAVKDTVNDPSVGDPHFTADGTGIYFKSHDALGRASLWLQSIAGGRPRLLVRFDDLTRPSFRPNFTTDGKRFYFAINNRESDIWVADLTTRQ